MPSYEKCPECLAKVLGRRLDRHVLRVHTFRAEDMKRGEARKAVIIAGTGYRQGREVGG